MKRLCLACACSLLCLSFCAGQPPEARKGTIAYVMRLQTKDGGFLASEPEPKEKAPSLPTLRATSSAIRALKYLGGQIPNPKACANFVASCFDEKTGGFADRPKAQPDVFTTAVGLMAVAELNMPETYHAPVAKYLSENAKSFDDIRIAVAGLERIKQRSPANEAWVKEVGKLKIPEDKGAARMAASVAVTWLRLGQEGTFAEQLLKLVKAGQRNDGGFGKADAATSDLETTYRVMRYFMMLKERPDEVEQVRTLVAKCRNEDGGYGVAPGQPSNISGTYFAAIISYWLGDNK